MMNIQQRVRTTDNLDNPDGWRWGTAVKIDGDLVLVVHDDPTTADDTPEGLQWMAYQGEFAPFVEYSLGGTARGPLATIMETERNT